MLRVEYMGVLLTKGTICSSPWKLVPPPADVKSVRHFMGLAGIFGSL